MLNKIENDLLYLMKCGTLKTVPDIEKVHQMDMEAIYELAKFHYIQAYIARVLKTMNKEYPLQDKWEEALNVAIHYRIVMDVYAKNLFSFLEEKKCWYMPLKGYVLKDLYPAFGIRQMSDTDILFDSRFRQDVRDYFVSHGFEVKKYHKANDDIYIKDDKYTFEMHVSLFEEGFHKIQYDYFQNLENSNHVLKDSYHYYMDAETFYIYLVSHAQKHYSRGGTGIRQLLDFYYYLNNNDLDFKYIDIAVDQLGISDFEQTIRSLSLNCFEKDELTENEQKMLEYLFQSGTYGNFEHFVINEMEGQDNSKLKYIWNRLFPSRKWIMLKYPPIIGKSIVLIPFLWIYRFFRAATKSRTKIKNELIILNKDKK